MIKTQKPVIILMGLLILFFLAWYFRYIVSCGIIALILASMGRPLMNFLLRIRYKRFHIKEGLAALLTLSVILFLMAAAFRWFFPMVIQQVASLNNINLDYLLEYYKEPIEDLQYKLIQLNIIDQNQTLKEFISYKALNYMKGVDYNSVITQFFSFTWSLVLGIFTTLFFTFFILKENHLAMKVIHALTPNEYYKEVGHIIQNSRKLISRYFIGISLEIIFITAALSICFTIFGFPNALLIAFCCGMMVLIPYLGSIIGGVLALIILLASMISVDPTLDVLPVIIKFVLAFTSVKLIDDFVVQPLIYSRSVKAHPLEIFIVIMAAGKLGGIVGMILAVPMYTFIRIFAKEFFQYSKFVRNITRNL